MSSTLHRWGFKHLSLKTHTHTHTYTPTKQGTISFDYNWSNYFIGEFYYCSVKIVSTARYFLSHTHTHTHNLLLSYTVNTRTHYSCTYGNRLNQVRGDDIHFNFPSPKHHSVVCVFFVFGFTLTRERQMHANVAFLFSSQLLRSSRKKDASY